MWLCPYKGPGLNYIRPEASQGPDPVERTLPQSSDNVLGAKAFLSRGSF